MGKLSFEYLIKEAFLSLYNIFFDSEIQEFLEFEPNTCIWKIIIEDDVLRLVRELIEKTPHFITSKTTQEKYYISVVKALKSKTSRKVKPTLGVMFKDTFFNFSTGQPEEPKPEHYCRRYIDTKFDPEQSMDKKVKGFIKTLCNNDNFQVMLLQHNLKNVLRRVNKSQTAFFFVGPAATGKTTWTNELMWLMEDLGTSWRADRLSGRFNTFDLKGKGLLTLTEITPKEMTPPRLGLFKSIACWERIPTEKKQGLISTHVFEGNVVLNGNNRLNLEASNNADGTGISRRLLNFPCTTAVKNPDPYLDELLIKNCVPIIKWGLSCNLPDDFLFNKVPEINKVLANDEPDGLKAFIDSQIYYNKNLSIPLGVKKLREDSFYYQYRLFCIKYDYEILGPYKFSDKVLSYMQSQAGQVNLKKDKKGQNILGVGLKPETDIEKITLPYVDEFRKLEPFNDA